MLSAHHSLIVAHHALTRPGDMQAHNSPRLSAHVPGPALCLCTCCQRPYPHAVAPSTAVGVVSLGLVVVPMESAGVQRRCDG